MPSLRVQAKQPIEPRRLDKNRENNPMQRRADPGSPHSALGLALHPGSEQNGPNHIPL